MSEELPEVEGNDLPELTAEEFAIVKRVLDALMADTPPPAEEIAPELLAENVGLAGPLAGPSSGPARLSRAARRADRLTS